jgi:transposase
MSQQSVSQAVRRSALDAQSVRRKGRAQRERRLEGLAVEVMTGLRERDAAVRDAERRACAALQTMTDEDGLSVREITRQLPRSTAGRWIAAAREAGYLGPSEGMGKAGG